jgi:hypothetical protein
MGIQLSLNQLTFAGEYFHSQPLLAIFFIRIFSSRFIPFHGLFQPVAVKLTGVSTLVHR